MKTGKIVEMADMQLKNNQTEQVRRQIQTLGTHISKSKNMYVSCQTKKD